MFKKTFTAGSISVLVMTGFPLIKTSRVLVISIADRDAMTGADIRLDATCDMGRSRD